MALARREFATSRTTLTSEYRVPVRGVVFLVCRQIQVGTRGAERASCRPRRGPCRAPARDGVRPRAGSQPRAAASLISRLVSRWARQPCRATESIARPTASVVVTWLGTVRRSSG